MTDTSVRRALMEALPATVGCHKVGHRVRSGGCLDCEDVLGRCSGVLDYIPTRLLPRLEDKAAPRATAGGIVSGPSMVVVGEPGPEAVYYPADSPCPSLVIVVEDAAPEAPVPVDETQPPPTNPRTGKPYSSWAYYRRTETRRMTEAWKKAQKKATASRVVGVFTDADGTETHVLESGHVEFKGKAKEFPRDEAGDCDEKDGAYPLTPSATQTLECDLAASSARTRVERLGRILDRVDADGWAVSSDEDAVPGPSPTALEDAAAIVMDVMERVKEDSAGIVQEVVERVRASGCPLGGDGLQAEPLTEGEAMAAEHVAAEVPVPEGDAPVDSWERILAALRKLKVITQAWASTLAEPTEPTARFDLCGIWQGPDLAEALSGLGEAVGAEEADGSARFTWRVNVEIERVRP